MINQSTKRIPYNCFFKEQKKNRILNEVVNKLAYNQALNSSQTN